MQISNIIKKRAAEKDYGVVCRVFHIMISIFFLT